MVESICRYSNIQKSEKKKYFQGVFFFVKLSIKIIYFLTVVNFIIVSDNKI